MEPVEFREPFVEELESRFVIFFPLNVLEEFDGSIVEADFEGFTQG